MVALPSLMQWGKPLLKVAVVLQSSQWHEVQEQQQQRGQWHLQQQRGSCKEAMS
jgi:hypothetical protein